MSNDTSIRAEALGKRYRISLKDEVHDTFAGMLGSWLRSPIVNYRRLRSLTRFEASDDPPQRPEDRVGSDVDPQRPPQPSGSIPHPSEDIIWALRDVSFEIKKGEVLGIIGRNGAGKSTLLKILSRITEPTAGRVEIHGRIASLLEVGTGFHPELSGRDNVYLNGTILGMTKKEVDAKFNDIVAFSGIDKFIDTPAKRYSTGMRVRLAFAVAAHLDPEILLVDEVLAVGDIEFQQKCLGKMSEVASEGRTVLFVSHNLAAVSQLCQSGLLLDAGRIVSRGPIGEVVATYAQLVAASDRDAVPTRREWVEIRELQVASEETVINPSTPLIFRFRIEIRKSYWRVLVQLGITTPEGLKLVLDSIDSKRHPELLQPGSYDVAIALPALWLRPRSYSSRIKIIAHPETGPTERFYSEWVQFHVKTGSFGENRADHVLSPHGDWCVHALDQHQELPEEKTQENSSE